MSISQKIGLRKVYQGTWSFFENFCALFLSSSSITKLHVAILSNCSFHLLTQWRICLIAYHQVQYTIENVRTKKREKFYLVCALLLLFVGICVSNIILYTIIIQLHTMPGILLKYGFRMKETSISFEKQELIIFYLPPGAVIAIVKALWTWDFSWILGKSCV